MRRAKITRKEGYQCAPEGFRVDRFEFGAIVTGKVAEWALADKAAQAMFDPREEAKVETVPEVKAAPKRRGRKKKADTE